MRAAFIAVAALLACLAAGCGGSKTVTATRTVTVVQTKTANGKVRVSKPRKSPQGSKYVYPDEVVMYPIREPRFGFAVRFPMAPGDARSTFGHPDGYYRDLKPKDFESHLAFNVAVDNSLEICRNTVSEDATACDISIDPSFDYSVSVQRNAGTLYCDQNGFRFYVEGEIGTWYHCADGFPADTLVVRHRGLTYVLEATGTTKDDDGVTKKPILVRQFFGSFRFTS
jgi:hypothetical protein